MTLVAIATFGGCDASTTAASGFLDDNGNAPSEPNGTPTTDTPFAVGDDSGTTKQDSFRGSSLCKIKPDDCVPDDDGYHNAVGATGCAVATTDADGGATGVLSSCRLQKDASGAYAPNCQDNAGPGGDGATCSTGLDCAGGFDCVSGDKGGVCRRYCCLGSCGTQTSQSGGSTFCDVQQLVGGNKAPVCMPLKHCTLLGSGECDATETCAVVNESGDSGCVANGDAQANADCDQVHCASGLSCLGQSGNRKCYQLCRVDMATTCASGQVCKTSSLFKDQTVGTCQTPPSN